MLELKNIKKHFKVKRVKKSSKEKTVRAVDYVDLKLNEGENLSLVGESGCGKTTMARIILKLMAPDEGSIILNGDDVTRLKKKDLRRFRQKVQMVFQDPYSSLDPRFTVRSVLKEAFTLSVKFRSDQEMEKRIHELLEAVGLNADMLSRYPHEFSGGERQRIAIARALVLNPKLLILDEAVSSLDVIIQEQIIELLKDLQRRFGLTYLFISHNLKVVKKISQRIAVMYRGKIVESAETKEIFENPLHPYTRELLAAAVEYKAIERKEDIQLSSQAQLVDRGDGHWVLT